MPREGVVEGLRERLSVAVVLPVRVAEAVGLGGEEGAGVAVGQALALLLPALLPVGEMLGVGG